MDEYFVHKGYFVQHNLKFLPRKDQPDFVTNQDSNHSDIDQDSNHSDIDVVGDHPLIKGERRVPPLSGYLSPLLS